MSGLIKNLLVSSALALATATLAGCASGGGAGEPVDLLLNDGTLAPPRNTILTQISYLHPAESDGVDEVYDIGAVTLTVDIDPTNGAQTFAEGVRGFFNDGNTLTYDASANTFTFDVTSGTHTMNDSFGPIMTTNPVDYLGLRYGDRSYILAAFPTAFGLDPAIYLGNPGAVDNYLYGLAQSGAQADADLVEALLASADIYLASDYFSYVSPSGVTYHQLKLSNNAITSNYTSLGIWVDDTDPTQLTYGINVYGERTPVYDVPITGSARYTGTTSGRLWNVNRLNYLTGGVTFDMDFLTQQITFQYIAEVGETGISGNTEFFYYDTFSGSGAINNDTFSVDFVSDSDDSMEGELEGAFFGLAADEVGGTFVFGNGDAYGIGGFIAVKEPE